MRSFQRYFAFVSRELAQSDQGIGRGAERPSKLRTWVVQSPASCFLFLLLACGVPSYPQATAVVQITGTVQDPEAGAVVGAEITAIQPATGFARKTTSGKDGSYVLTGLPIGPYQINATAAGFKTYTQKGIVLEVNTNPTVNIILEIGAVSQSVEVRATAEMAETQSTGLSQVIDQRRLRPERCVCGDQPSFTISLRAP